MTNPVIIENKISAIRKYAKMLDFFKHKSIQEIENNPILKSALERYLYLTFQSTIDLGEAVISYKDFRKPTSYSEIFEVLTEEKIISTSSQEELIKMTGLRKAIAHDYEKLKFEVVYKVMQEKLPIINKFISTIKKKLKL